jgi:hypothetical protein
MFFGSPLLLFISFERRGPSRLKMSMKPPLCDHDTSCFSKEQHCFYALFYSLPMSAILCKLAHEQKQRDTNALGKSKN